MLLFAFLAISFAPIDREVGLNNSAYLGTQPPHKIRYALAIIDRALRL
ncbi:MAG: hypothetical protein WAN50_01395 [Minisyncoccia bacterium]